MEDLPLLALSSIYSYLDFKDKLNLRASTSKLRNASKTVSCWDNIASVNVMDVDCCSFNQYGICTNQLHDSVQLVIEAKDISFSCFHISRDMFTSFVTSALQYARNITSLTIHSKQPDVVDQIVKIQYQKLTHLAVTSRLTAREIPSILKLIRG